MKKQTISYLVLFGLVLLHFFFRWTLMHSPFFSEMDYDEAITGLVGLHAFKGEPQLFLWGRARMGALESILAGFIFFLIGPSTMAMQLSLVLVSTFILILCYFLGSQLGGRGLGLFSAAFWAIPPLFLSFTALYAMGGHLEAVTAGAFLLYGLGRLLFNPPKNPVLLGGLMGLIAGLGWWSSMLISVFIATVLISIAFSQPRLLVGRTSLAGIGGFILGSLPFWIWNYHYDFMVFTHLGVGGSGSIFHQIHSFFSHSLIPAIKRIVPVISQTVVPTLIGTYWDLQTVFPGLSKILSFPIFLLYYLPLGILVASHPVLWISRMIRFKSPFRKPVDLIILTVWSFLAFRSFLGEGELLITRYTLGLYVPLTILMGYWLWQLVRFKRTLGILAVSGLLVFHSFMALSYFQQQKNVPHRPVEAIIKKLHDLGIQYCYADSRISQVITFESQEKIICSDYYGISNYDYLKTVDNAPFEKVSIITHKVLGNPFPEVMEASLRLLGTAFKRSEVGEYVLWYDFKGPLEKSKPLTPLDWKIASSEQIENAGLIFDRDISTVWRATKKPGAWIMVDLGKTTLLSGISLLSDPKEIEILSGIRLELSIDGKKWRSEKEEGEFLQGLHWFRNRPKLNFYPRQQITFPPQSARYLRLTNIEKAEYAKGDFSIAELFIYEASPNIYRPSKKSLQAFEKAQEALDHWMDDPTGPHPQFYNIPADHRRRQVHWPTVINSLDRAIQESPEWEEPHYLLGDALNRSNFLSLTGNRELDYKGFYPLTPLISSSSWKVSANFNKQEAKLAVDHNPNTRWTSLKPQEPGMFFEVDMGQPHLVKGISLLLGNSFNDYPRILEIQVSGTEKNWKAVKTESRASYSLAQNHLIKRMYYTFPATMVRSIRLNQKGKDPESYWSIHELEISTD